MWTSEQVLALSPDASSTRNGKSLANPAKWPLLGQADQVIWGECKGSGKKPYRTQIDLREPAFRCSCPSRKFPCKHALGLFLLLAEQADALTAGEPPDWVSEWLGKRSHTAARKQAKPTKPVDPKVQAQQAAKRAAKRAAKVEAGIADLSQWMEDRVRQGLATLPSQPYRFWDQAAARLVDAQAPGLARRVRVMAGIVHSGDGWPERMLTALGQLQLLVQGYRQIDALAPAMQAELRSQIGWPQTQEDLRQRAQNADPLVERITDTWQILGQVVTEEDNLKTQRIWLWGSESGRSALVLNFAHGRQPLDVSWVPGLCFAGTLIFYPGTGVRRAFAESREAVETRLPEAGIETLEEAIALHAQALSENPWTERFPLLLRHMLLKHQAGDWWLQDLSGAALPLSPQFGQPWELMALSGGYPISVFGEWDGSRLLPLSAWTDQQCTDQQFVVLGE